MIQGLRSSGPEQNGAKNETEGLSQGVSPETEGRPEVLEKLSQPEVTGEKISGTGSSVGAMPDPAAEPSREDASQTEEPSASQVLEESPDRAEKSKIDEVFIQGGKDIIRDYEGKPYEEKEEHYKLQAKYLWQRFKKALRIDKS